MRAELICVLAVVALAAAGEYAAEEPWVEEEDVEDNYDDEAAEETHSRRRREVYVEGPYEEHIRIKRCDDEPVYRVRRSQEYVRVPRQVHQYEVHEYSDDAAPASPPYEEMLAASADHYHRVYAAPGQPAARYLNPEHTEGYAGHHHVDKGAKGFKIDHNHRKEYEEAAGKKHKHHDHAGHKGSHEEEAHGSRGAKFDEKKGHKKGHKTKGYHNKYHKDEFHKEHKFYDDFHKSGEHHRYGKFHAKHASNESGKKKAHHVNAGHDFVEHGKKGYSNKGHMDADHKGYNGKHGHDEHHEHHSHHGKKGGKDGGSHWGYQQKH